MCDPVMGQRMFQCCNLAIGKRDSERDRVSDPEGYDFQEVVDARSIWSTLEREGCARWV